MADCEVCDDTGLVTISYSGGDGVREDADDQPCPEGCSANKDVWWRDPLLLTMGKGKQMKKDPEMSPRERDVRMMQSPLEWPLLLLPLKRFPEIGFMAGNGCKVYVGSFYDQAFMKNIREGNVQPLEYDSFGAVYDDGWRVD